MNTAVIFDPNQELRALCGAVRAMISENEYNKCFNLIRTAMGDFPDAPQPHNLMGILYQRQGNLPSAMRHFRAAYALDPGYRPAHENLDTFGTFFARGRIMYGDEDCLFEPEPSPDKKNFKLTGRK